MARNLEITNLNAGTLSPTALPVLKRCDALRRMQAENPSDFFWRQTKPLIDASRESLAGYLNCLPRDLILLPNVTNALNIAIASLDLPAGSEILFPDHEYGAILNAWKRRAQENGWTLRSFELPYLAEEPAEYVRAFKAAISPQTRVLFFSHVTYTTGLVLPAEELCDAARLHGLLTVVDGAHAPGGVPVDLSQVDADFYGANLHKWVMCPCSAGFLFANRRHPSRMKPIVTSWGYPYDPGKAYEPSDQGGSIFQWSLEYQGVSDRTPQMVVPEVLAFRQSIGGEEAIHDRVRQIGDYALDILGKLLPPSIPRDYARRGPIVSFAFPACDPVAIRDRFYADFRIECPVTVVGERCFLRVSTAWFNTPGEIDRLHEAVRHIVR